MKRGNPRIWSFPAAWATTTSIALLCCGGCQDNDVIAARSVPWRNDTAEARYNAASIAAGVSETIADASEAALHRPLIGRFVSFLAEADRDRLSNWASSSGNPALEDVTERVLQLWHRRYDEPLRVDQRVAFGLNYDRLIIRAKDSGVATAVFAAERDLAEVRVFLLRQDNHWRIDAPDALSPEELHDNLLRHLTQFLEAAEQWPDDVNEAQYLLARHVMAAVYGL